MQNPSFDSKEQYVSSPVPVRRVTESNALLQSLRTDFGWTNAELERNLASDAVSEIPSSVVYGGYGPNTALKNVTETIAPLSLLDLGKQEFGSYIHYRHWLGSVLEATHQDLNDSATLAAMLTNTLEDSDLSAEQKTIVNRLLSMHPVLRQLRETNPLGLLYFVTSMISQEQGDFSQTQLAQHIQRLSQRIAIGAANG